MKLFYIFTGLLVLFTCKVHGQDTIPLAEVEVSDSQLHRFSTTQQTLLLTDSIARFNDASLTSLLNYNSFIYFKENGAGMVSSPSFRGTTASQTAVVWNGININSQFNGQTDFNTVNVRNFDAVEVRSGGGSVLFGSGAIGGSIHLNDYIKFGDELTNTLFAKYGSFNTSDLSYKGTYATKKLSVNLSISRAGSDNDYPFVDGNRDNSNGQYYNQTAALNVGYKLNDKNILKWYGYVYDGDRNFSVITPTETRTSYTDFNTRNLVEWDGFYGKFISKLKLAYITESYKYYQDIYEDTYTNGDANSVIGKYDLAYRWNPKMLLNFVANVTHTTGEGSSVNENKRTITAFNLLWKHEVSDFFDYQTTVRKEATQNYESPLLFSLGTAFHISDHYAININGSKNFRIPTYNDLFWAGSGNPDLNPETAYQAELSNNFEFKNLAFSITAYYNDITDMIQWVPQGAVWKPVNTQHVTTYGLESKVNYKKQLGKHSFSLSGTYAYTMSNDEETDKELIYVPNHKLTGMLQYQYNEFAVYYQVMHISKAYFTTDNIDMYAVDPYTIGNVGASFEFGKKQQYILGGSVNNLWNVAYENVANRPMPGRNMNIYINITI